MKNLLMQVIDFQVHITSYMLSGFTRYFCKVLGSRYNTFSGSQGTIDFLWCCPLLDFEVHKVQYF